MKPVALVLKVIRVLRYYFNRLAAAVSGRWFDWRLGIETSKPLDRYALDVPADKKLHAWSYEPCSMKRFRCIMKMFPEHPKEFTFVDIGSGKGRLLILAEEMGFDKIIGVEFSPSLHQATTENLKKLRLHNGRKQNIQLLNCDATTLQIPTDNCILFMFNPFQEPVVEKFLENLLLQTKNRSSSLYIIYVHPTAKKLIENTNAFTKMSEQQGLVDTIVYKLKLS